MTQEQAPATIIPLTRLPAWATPHEDFAKAKSLADVGVVVVDPDLAYPALLKELGVPDAEINKYWLEVVYQCVKLDLQTAMGRFGFKILIRSDGDRKERWALSKWPGGPDQVLRATKGLEAKAHYRRIRGFIPS